MTQPVRILIVDDNNLIAQLFIDVLAERGYHAIGPAETLARALRLATHEQIDVAVLDVNIRGELITPVADKLLERGIPFLFMTGYEPLPDARFRKVLLLKKPFLIDDLLGGIAAILPPRLRDKRNFENVSGRA